MTTTIAGALRDASRRLDAVGGTGRLDATLLLEHLTGATRAALLAGRCARERRPLPPAHTQLRMRSNQRHLVGGTCAIHRRA